MARTEIAVRCAVAQDVVGGEEVPITVFTVRLGGGGRRPLQLPPAQLLAVSSRGELALSLKHRYFEGFHQAGHLALAPLEGGEPRGLGLVV